MDYGQTKVHKVAEMLHQCRDIVREIENFGINDIQRKQIIYLLSLNLEDREALEELSVVSKRFIGNPLEDAEKTQLEV
jgi:hypothetical protein